MSLFEKEDNYLNKLKCLLWKLKEITTKFPSSGLFEYQTIKRLQSVPSEKVMIMVLQIQTRAFYNRDYCSHCTKEGFLPNLKMTMCFYHSSPCVCCVSGCGCFLLYLLSILMARNTGVVHPREWVNSMADSPTLTLWGSVFLTENNGPWCSLLQ